MSATITRTVPRSFIYSLFFLFPVLIVNVRHWGSVTFALLLISSLFYAHKTYKYRKNFNAHEYIFFSGFYVYFFVCLVAIIFSINIEASIKSLELDARYLFIPLLYVMFVEINPRYRTLSIGFIGLAMASIFINIYSADVFGQKEVGIYSRLFTGPLLAIAFAWLLVGFLYTKKKLSIFAIVLAVSLILTLINIMYVGGRSSYLAIIVILLLSLFRLKLKNAITLAGVFVFFLFASYMLIDGFSSRIDQSLASLNEYYFVKNPAKKNKNLSSLEARIEMAKIAKYSFKDYPVTGVGKNNYNTFANKYINAGKLHPELSKHSHPHNAYVDVLVNQGLLGLVSILFVFIYPLYVYIKNPKKNDQLALVGMMFSVSIMIFSLTETAVLSKNNFNAVFVIFSTLIFYMYNHSDKVK